MFPFQESLDGKAAYNRFSRCAFTLIELLITMALIIVLFVMLHGSGSRSYQQRQLLACQKNLKTVYIALQLYANDHAGAFPIRPNAQTSEDPLSMLVPRYTSVTEIFTCPGSKDERLPEGQPFERRKISYSYFMGTRIDAGRELLMSDEQINAFPKLQGKPLFSTDGKPPGDNHNKYGGNLMFCDGEVETRSPKAKESIVLADGIVLLNPRP